MAIIDLGDGATVNIENGGSGAKVEEEKTPLNGNPDTTDLGSKPDNNGGEGDDSNKPSNEGKPGENKGDEGKPGDDNSLTGELTAGTEIEFDGVKYTVDNDGNIVDNEGNIFKKADEVDAWIKENEVAKEEQIEIPLKNVMDKIGIEVKDEKGNPVEFTNDEDGLEAYINSIVEIKSNEATKATLNKFYQDNPIVKQFVDFVTVNNGDYRGFGQLPDRSGVEVIKDNETQQENIIRLAAAEFGNKGVTDAYIKYLKDSGSLYDEACNQLQALKEKDAAYRERISQEAEIRRQAEEEAITEYFNKIDNIISSRNIGGYKIPESFVKEVNGQKITLTPNDFYNYLYKQTEVDADGNKITGYQKDLAALDDDKLMTNELINAWLLFTGGDFKDLATMAAKEREVRKLILTSKKTNSRGTIKINKPTNGNIDKVVFD